MDGISANYLARAELWLLITTLTYFLMNGAQIFETAVIVPKWTASPPKSFEIFKGKYGLDFKPFWITMHSIHEITFLLAIIFCWRIDPIRTWLLILFAVHFAVRVWTIVYFAPKIIEFQTIANASDFSGDLSARANLWRTLNYIRVAIFVGVSFGLIPLCLQALNLRMG